MEKFKKQLRMANQNETIIAQGVKVEGEFSSDGDVIIDGELIGSVKTTQSLHIGSSARIHASVSAASAVVAGEVKGDIHSEDRLELTETSRITGDIETKLLSIAPGAIVNGNISMGGKKSSTAGDVEVDA